MSRWLADFDAQQADATFELLLLLEEATNWTEHQTTGAPPKTEAELRLEFLERRAAKRAVCAAADAGDRQAVAQLVRERAELEVLFDEAREIVRAEEEALRASVRKRPQIETVGRG